MRIWDLPPCLLCRQHLLGEHRELHAIWTILTEDRTGYRNHPETKRWVGNLLALYLRHEKLVAEMLKRGYHHRTELDRTKATGGHCAQPIQSIGEQITILKGKGCLCFQEE